MDEETRFYESGRGYHVPGQAAQRESAFSAGNTGLVADEDVLEAEMRTADRNRATAAWR